MEEALRDRVREAAEKHALLNALKHGSDARVGAVMGPLMGENPNFREHGDEVPAIVAPVVESVNALDESAQRERLAELDPELLEELEADAEGESPALPSLPGADAVEKVRMRVAPNPNGPWHLGHARMPAVIGTYKDRYDGWFLCRFDDTDPETKRPMLEAYDWILEDIAYLGFEPDEVVRASDRLERYYEAARETIEIGDAYTCSCPQAEFSAMKNAAEACPHRHKSPERVAEEFDRMTAGDYDAGEMVLRIRTDIDHPNPALRDWVAFRLVETPHPRAAASDYRCWPLLDFQSGIDDHDFGITHIVRGIDLQDSAGRQGYLYDALGWDYPEVVHWGHVRIDEFEGALSTSRLRERIEAGELDGWDDPRAPTLRSVRRRGIRGEAVTAAMIELGTSTSNVDLSMSSVYARNRELIDDGADRAFLVRDPVERPLVGGPEVAEVPVHPDHDERGRRSIPVTDAVLLEPADLPAKGGRVWLKGLGCVRVVEDGLEVTDDDIEAVRSGAVDVVHWVPAGPDRAVLLRTPEGDRHGRAEPGVADYPVDAVLQFERVGFARIDDQNDRTVAFFAHG